MPSNDLYFLIMVCGTFVVFGVVLASNSVKYRHWLKQHPAEHD